MWPSAFVLSQWLATNPSYVHSKRVLELGAGCGLSGLVAARLMKLHSSPCQTSQVILTDFNKIVLENLLRNVTLNNVTDICSVIGTNFYDQLGNADKWKDTNGSLHEPVDVVLAADVICQPDDAYATANSIHDALIPGGNAFVVSANTAHRFGVEFFLDACKRVNLDVQANEVGDDLLNEDMKHASGYVPGMQLTMFKIAKPMR